MSSGVESWALKSRDARRRPATDGVEYIARNPASTWIPGVHPTEVACPHDRPEARLRSDAAASPEARQKLVEDDLRIGPHRPKLEAGERLSAPTQPFLPEKHRRALEWSYCNARNPARIASDLGVSLAGLADLIREGRQMLANREMRK